MTIPDQDERLEAIRARAEAATPGPWIDYDNVHGAHIIRMPDRLGGGNIASMDVRNSNGATEQDLNAAFIAAVREDVPFLLDLVVREREQSLALLTALHEIRKFDTEPEFSDVSDGDAFERIELIAEDALASYAAAHVQVAP